MGKHGSKHGAQKNSNVVLKVIVALLLAVVVGFGGWLGVSFKRVSDYYGQAGDAYTQMDACVQSEDYKQALAYAREAASYASQGSEELQGIQWNIAEKVPVLGTDVKTMRSIGSISGTLADDAVLPTLDAIDELMGDGVTTDNALDLSKVTDKLDQVVQLATKLQEADSVVNECSVKAGALPKSHFGAVNGWASSLKESIKSIDTMLDKFVGIAQMVTGMSDAFGSLMGETSQG